MQEEIKALIEKALLVSGLNKEGRGEIASSLFKVVLFTDICNFTKTTNKYGDTVAVSLRNKHDETLKPIIEANRGRYVKSTGDGLIALFDKPKEAVESGIKIQRHLAGYNKKASERENIHIRIGINMGEVRFIDEDPIGDTVNITERVLSMKKKGLSDKDRILITSAVYDDIKEEFGCRFHGFRKFKNVLVKIGVYEVLWDEEENERQKPKVRKIKQKIKYKGKVSVKKIKDKLLVEALYRCCICPQHLNTTEFHHILPVNEGGQDIEDNLIVVCPTCHQDIHDHPNKYTPERLKMSKKRWTDSCTMNLPLEELLKTPGITIPIEPSLHNQTPPEPNFVGRVEILETITKWYKSQDVKIGALIGWGGFGKSALARKWFDSLAENGIKPDGIFWWGFYRNPYLDRFLEELLEYLAGGRIDLTEIKSTWQKVEKIKKFITEGEYLIILDGLEEMQKKKQGEEFGKMQHPEFKEILTSIADSNYKGLCLITTRFPMKDIESYPSYQRLDVEELSKEDTRQLFQKIGVSGSPDEIDAVWEEFKGHTLSLVLLANHPGLGDDIKKAKKIPPFYSDKEAGGKAHRILLWYDKQLNEKQRQFMKIFSLFRQAVNEKEFEDVFLPLTKMEYSPFTQMRNDLCQRRLILKSPDNTYTTHPLIKGYFESIFDEKDKISCHKAIYEYFGRPAQGQPETLEEMQPLFEQVYHGCSAGLYDEVFYNVYWKKICREEEYFITKKLGAWETNLSLARSFFPNGDLSQMPLVSKKKDKSFLLNGAGLTLLNIGKPKEARELLEMHNKIAIECGDWKAASIGYRNLARLQFRIGELEDGFENAKRALEFSEKANSDWYIYTSKAYFGWILHLLDKDKEAEEYFNQADELEKNVSGNRLHRLRGVFYADFLISIGRIDEAFELTKTNLEICQKNNLPADISICHRCLAAIERIKRNHNEAETHLQEAIKIAKKIGMPELEIEALLEFSRLDLDRGEYKGAIDKADDALKIIDRTGFKIYEPQAELILAKTYLNQGNKEKAKSLANSTYQKANQMNYYRPKQEATQILERIKP